MEEFILHLDEYGLVETLNNLDQFDIPDQIRDNMEDMKDFLKNYLNENPELIPVTGEVE
jgi:patatin-like phospholipase/acyl hydrolase